MKKIRQLSNDSPKFGISEDNYGRSKFAEQIAAEIRSWKGNESLAIGLTGPWGSGKTTLKNFVCEALNRRRRSRKMPIISFNPWQLSGRASITEAFFKDLESVFEADAADERSSIKRLSRRLNVVSSMGKGLSKLLQAMGVVATAFDPESGNALNLASRSANEAAGIMARGYLINKSVHFSHVR